MKNKSVNKVSDIQKEEDIEKIKKCLEKGDNKAAQKLYSELLQKYTDEPSIVFETSMVQRMYGVFANVFNGGEAPSEMPEMFGEDNDYLKDLKIILTKLEESLEPKELPEA